MMSCFDQFAINKPHLPIHFYYHILAHNTYRIQANTDPHYNGKLAIYHTLRWQALTMKHISWLKNTNTDAAVSNASDVQVRHSSHDYGSRWDQCSWTRKSYRGQLLHVTSTI